MNIEISQLSLTINTFIRITTAIIFLAFIIPLQWKEANVKNGLKKLRKQLLVSGLIIFHLNIIGLSVVLIKYVTGDSSLQGITEIVTLISSLGFFAIAIIEYQVYHQRYTPEQKKLHAEFEKMEVAANKAAFKKENKIDKEGKKA